MHCHSANAEMSSKILKYPSIPVRCNGIYECSDYSDELGCNGKQTSHTIISIYKWTTSTLYSRWGAVAVFLVPDWGDGTGSCVGLSYRPE
jgi:hypothetical protein